MNTLEEKKRFMRDYWLDALSDNQSGMLETEWFGNDEDAELLEIVRHDLIEDYLTNSLSRAELDKFKNRFLINNPEEVAIAKYYFELSRTVERQTAKAGFFETLAENWRGFIKIPQIAVAALLLAGTALFINFYNAEPVQIVKNDSPAFERDDKTPPASIPVPLNEANAGGDNIDPETTAKNNQNSGEESVKSAVVKNKTTSEKPPEKPVRRQIQPQILFLTNFRGNVKTLKFAGENKNFSLKLDMPGIDKAYRSYEVRIYDSNDNLVVRQKLSDNLSVKKSGEKIEIRNLGKNKFKRNGTYKTYLVGYDEKNNVEELSVYDSFKVD
jgi:hypothetical protein